MTRHPFRFLGTALIGAAAAWIMERAAKVAAWSLIYGDDPK